MIEIDGSEGEGGGQVLRTAVALATVLQQEIRVFNIRAGRSEPGLKAQHLTGVKAVATICSGSLTGAHIGSLEITYTPRRLKDGVFHFDVGTAGSTTLVLQTMMPVLAFVPGNVRLEITGGTDVKWSPPVDYLRLVVLPLLERVGYRGRLEVVRRGHYPKGGGIIRFSSRPISGFSPFTGTDRGEVFDVGGVSHAVGLPAHVAERQAESARKIMRDAGLPDPKVAVETAVAGDGLGPGSGIVLCAKARSGAVLGADSLGERGKPAEAVGSEAGKILVDEVSSGAFLDRHMGDMIVPYMALADGFSEVSVAQVTQHILTNVKVAEKVAGVKFEVEGDLGNRGIIRASGVALRNVQALS